MRLILEESIYFVDRCGGKIIIYFPPEMTHFKQYTLQLTILEFFDVVYGWIQLKYNSDKITQ